MGRTLQAVRGAAPRGKRESGVRGVGWWGEEESQKVARIEEDNAVYIPPGTRRLRVHMYANLSGS